MAHAHEGGVPDGKDLCCARGRRRVFTVAPLASPPPLASPSSLSFPLCFPTPSPPRFAIIIPGSAVVRLRLAPHVATSPHAVLAAVSCHCVSVTASSHRHPGPGLCLAASTAVAVALLPRLRDCRPRLAATAIRTSPTRASVTPRPPVPHTNLPSPPLLTCTPCSQRFFFFIFFLYQFSDLEAEPMMVVWRSAHEGPSLGA